MQTTIVDDLETDFGTAILSALTGQYLTRNGQAVRLFDQTRHSAEYFFRSDAQGKPYVQNFAEGKRYYPLTAYCQIYNVDYATAKQELCQQYGLDYGGIATTTRVRATPTPLPPAPVDYLPSAVYQASQSRFERNGLYLYLTEWFDESIASQLFDQYRLGTSRRWQFKGTMATCLPQFDTAGNLRQVKVIPFHPVTGRRAKAGQDARKWNERSGQYEPDPNEKVWFAGKTLAGTTSVNLQQCYFGEHLLAEHPAKPVALVEGESTAVVCSAIWPRYIWLATGGSTGGKWYAPERFAVLAGRKVVLWPDTGKYADWYEKSQPLCSLASSLRVSRYVEENAPAGAGNIDLRDLLTWPRYTPLGGKPIFGEVLAVEASDTYPAEWDEAPAMTAPTLIVSPNRETFAQVLRIPPEDLPLYRLSRAA